MLPHADAAVTLRPCAVKVCAIARLRVGVRTSSRPTRPSYVPTITVPLMPTPTEGAPPAVPAEEDAPAPPAAAAAGAMSQMSIAETPLVRPPSCISSQLMPRLKSSARMLPS